MTRITFRSPDHFKNLKLGRKKPARHEETLQLQVAAYIRLQYPDVIFSSEGSGVRLSKSQAGKTKMMRSSGKLPDLWILEPMNGYHGLILELKADSVYLKDGSLSMDKHVQAQNKILQRLVGKRYWATFACGFDEARRMIDNYMTPPPR